MRKTIDTINNHNAGMYFMRYSSKVSDADAVAYIERKEMEELQQKTKKHYEELLKYDNPCCLRRAEMVSKVYVNYYDEEDLLDFSMYHYNIKNAKDKKSSVLTLWVGYDIGGVNLITGGEEPRGYYLYFTYRFSRDITGRKLLLFEVKRKMKTYLMRACDIASIFGKEIVTNYYLKLDIDWNKPIFERNGYKACWMTMERVKRFRTIKNCKLEI